MADGYVEIEATLDVQKAKKSLDSFSNSLKSTLDKAKASSQGLLTGMTVAAGGAVLFGVQAVKSAENVAAQNGKLKQIFKSMGESTDKAATDAIKYAEALENTTGVDAEVIKAGQAKLATFKAVSNGTARMNGTFDRATQAMIDLSAAGFGDTASTSVQLGKALQDPIKGITALGRSGVTFTKSQKDMIKSMVETGDMAGAQNIILGAVESQVGGVAESTATSSQKMANSLGNISEAIGAMLQPAVDKLVPVLQDLATSLGDGSFAEKLKEWEPAIFIVAGAITAALIPALISMAVAAWAAIAPLLPFIAIGAAIGAAIWLIITVFKNWGAIWDWLKEKAGKFVSFISDGVGKTFDKLKTWFSELPEKIKTALGNMKTLLSDAGSAIIQGLWDGMMSLWNKAKKWVTGIADWIKENKGPIEKDSKLLIPAGKAIIGGLSDGMKSEWKAIQKQVAGYTGFFASSGMALSAQAGMSKSTSVNYVQNFNSPITSYGDIVRANKDMSVIVAGALV